MKNSEMILHAILAKPKDLDAYRAYADALLEEGDELRGKFITANLGKRLLIEDARKSWNLMFYLDLIEVLSELSWNLSLIVENGLIVHVGMRFADFSQKARALFSAHPVQSVNLSDRYPTRYPSLSPDKKRTFSAFWCRGSHKFESPHYSFDYVRPNAFYLPSSLVDRFPAESIVSRNWCGFVDREAAFQAASVACVKAGRKMTGLLALPETDYGAVQSASDLLQKALFESEQMESE